MVETGTAPAEVPAAEAEVDGVAARLRPHFRRRPLFVLAWSRWRRRHQAVARACHIRRRRATPGEKRSL